jgi:GTP cyclohydrolase I
MDSTSPQLTSPLLAYGERKRDAKECKDKLERMSKAVTELLLCIGEDPTRHGLEDTPMRMAKALMFFTKGYEQDLREVVNGAVFDGELMDCYVAIVRSHSTMKSPTLME